jgi:hypothetical protein
MRGAHVKLSDILSVFPAKEQDMTGIFPRTANGVAMHGTSPFTPFNNAGVSVVLTSTNAMVCLSGTLTTQSAVIHIFGAGVRQEAKILLWVG